MLPINIKIIYFVPDNRKEGGAYVTDYGNVVKIDEDKSIIVLDGKLEIKFDIIMEIIIEE